IVKKVYYREALKLLAQRDMVRSSEGLDFSNQCFGKTGKTAAAKEVAGGDAARESCGDGEVVGGDWVREKEERRFG
ncbi:hypothetical protein Droror1_Dr00008451, partial [Drosera rotundifolia]